MKNKLQSNGLSEKANDTIKELRGYNYTMREIKEAMCDGLYLSTTTIDQDTAEEINDWIQYR